jgi:hypothetical protein
MDGVIMALMPLALDADNFNGRLREAVEFAEAMLRPNIKSPDTTSSASLQSLVFVVVGTLTCGDGVGCTGAFKSNGSSASFKRLLLVPEATEAGGSFGEAPNASGES